MNVRSVSQSEIIITLGDNDNDVCNVRTSSDTVSDLYIYIILIKTLYRRLPVCHQTNHQVPH